VVTDRMTGEHLGHPAATQQITEDITSSGALGALVLGRGAHPSYRSGPGHERERCNGCTVAN